MLRPGSLAVALLLGWPLAAAAGDWSVPMPDVHFRKSDGGGRGGRTVPAPAPVPGATEAAQGLALLDAGRYEDALPWLERAADLDRGNVAVRRALARCLEALGRRDEAVQALDAALALPGLGADARGALAADRDAIRERRAREEVRAVARESAAAVAAQTQAEVREAARSASVAAAAAEARAAALAAEAEAASSAVDLRGARATTVDPRVLKGQATSPSARAASAFQPARLEDLKFLFAEAPGRWPGPRNPDAPLVNPLREPDRYKALLAQEAGRFPQYRDRIERILAVLNTDTEQKRQLAVVNERITRRYHERVDAARERTRAELGRVLGAIGTQAGARDLPDLYARAARDTRLRETIRARTEPLLAAQDAVEREAWRDAMLELFTAFHRIDPAAPVR